MPLKRIESVLREKIGLHAESLGVSGVQRAVRARVSARGCKSEAEYATYLESHPEELEALIDEVVVRETWFFREAASIELLCSRLLKQATSGARSFKILSIPCATGEEPYSISMALLQAGLSA